MDKNLDGKISKDEFDRSARAFKRFDTDKDGFLTKEEFIARGNSGDAKKKEAEKPAVAEVLPTATAEQA